MPTEETPDETTDEKPAADLGDKGTAAVAAERKARRDAEARAKSAEAKLAELENAGKTEVERLTAQVASLTAELEKTALAAARYKVALDKGLTATQAKRLVGSNEDEFAEDADELLTDLGKVKPDEGKPDESEEKPAKRETPPPGSKPTERLKPGNGDPDAPVETEDVRAIAERMFRS